MNIGLVKGLRLGLAAKEILRVYVLAVLKNLLTFLKAAGIRFNVLAH